jgi:Carboxypeptidase regulatory-like domain
VKVIATFIASVLLSVFANAECVAVASVAQPSSRNVRILATLNGKPGNNATVEVVADGKDVFTVRTDEQGVAVLPTLLPGHNYGLTTTLNDRWRSETYLHILEQPGNEPTTVLVNLQPFVPLMKLSSREVRVLASVNGKPVKDATVEVFHLGMDLLSLRSDEQGSVILPPLFPGYDYSLIITADNGWRSEEHLYVLNDGSREATTVSFELEPTVSQTQGKLNAAAKKVAVSERVQFFKGTVIDPQGTEIPGTVIWVFSKDIDGKNTALSLVSDEHGSFSSVLPDGTYTVVFQSNGFRSRVVGLEISRDEKVKELKIPLEIGGC